MQETNFKQDKHINLNTYDILFKNRTYAAHASGGVVIYIKQNTTWNALPLNTDLEAVVRRILLPSGFITICSIYLPNSQTLQLSSLANLINQLPKPYLILGDCNSHSPQWGSNKTDNRGKIIETMTISFYTTLNNQPTLIAHTKRLPLLISHSAMPQ